MRNRSIQSRAFVFCRRGLRLAPESLRVFFKAVWLGLLDAPALEEIALFHYSGVRSGFETERQNLGGHCAWEATATEMFFSNCRTILVAGAGGGREAIALAKLGFQVTAFDFSEDLVSACRRNMQAAGVTARVLEAPPGRVPDTLGIYDGIVAGRGFYHHIPGRSQRIDFLKDCRAHVQSNAPLFLSDFHTRSSDSRLHRRTHSIASFVRRFRRNPRPVELGDWLDVCMQHAFVKEEIESELKAAGFDLEFYAVSPYSQDSRMAHAVARSI